MREEAWSGAIKYLVCHLTHSRLKPVPLRSKACRRIKSLSARQHSVTTVTLTTRRTACILRRLKAANVRKDMFADDKEDPFRDSQHGTVEKYNKRGKHLGEFDAETGTQTKNADSTREVEP